MNARQKEQLMNELTAMRQRVAELEKSDINHKLAEEALRENEDLFRLFMDYSPIYVFLKDKHIRSMQLSKNYEKMLGRPVHELIGKTMCDLFPSELAKSMVEDDLRILNEGKPMEVEEELNGRFYTTTKFPIIREGKPPCLAGFTMDITEAKLAEKALRESEESYRQLFDAESDAIFLIDNATGRIWKANQAACVMYGYSQDELLSLKNSDLSMEPEQTQEVTRETLPAADQVVIVSLRWHKKKDGAGFPVEITGRFFWKGGRVVHIAAIRDITERKQANEALRQKVDDLKRFNNLAVDRELRMVELKKEINALLKKSGRTGKVQDRRMNPELDEIIRLMRRTHGRDISLVDESFLAKSFEKRSAGAIRAYKQSPRRTSQRNQVSKTRISNGSTPLVDYYRKGFSGLGRVARPHSK